MSNARFFSAIALTAVVTSTLVAGLTLSRPAHAEAPRTAECKNFQSMSPGVETAEWMIDQLASGRTHFIVASNAGIAPLCAW